jgi:hypothetical protein
LWFARRSFSAASPCCVPQLEGLELSASSLSFCLLGRSVEGLKPEVEAIATYVAGISKTGGIRRGRSIAERNRGSQVTAFTVAPADPPPWNAKPDTTQRVLVARMSLRRFRRSRGNATAAPWQNASSRLERHFCNVRGKSTGQAPRAFRRKHGQQTCSGKILRQCPGR